ncbi:MAG: ribosome maturation factor RimP [Planctomycetes bacterium]|nr:ribosome maturation factor RimP [Planctomycetota bacterium]
MGIQELATELVESAAAELGLELVLVQVEPSRRVRCIIDREPGGVTIEDCAALSRAIGEALAASELGAASFHVEVMSPGLNRLLVRDKDFARFSGQTVRITLKHKVDGRRNFAGTLKEFTGQAIIIRRDDTGEEQAFARGTVKEVRLVPDLQ